MVAANGQSAYRKFLAMGGDECGTGVTTHFKVYGDLLVLHYDTGGDDLRPYADQVTIEHYTQHILGRGRRHTEADAVHEEAFLRAAAAVQKEGDQEEKDGPHSRAS
jgi:hypothetical protein